MLRLLRDISCTKQGHPHDGGGIHPQQQPNCCFPLHQRYDGTFEQVLQLGNWAVSQQSPLTNAKNDEIITQGKDMQIMKWITIIWIYQWLPHLSTTNRVESTHILPLTPLTLAADLVHAAPEQSAGSIAISVEVEGKFVALEKFRLGTNKTSEPQNLGTK